MGLEDEEPEEARGTPGAGAGRPGGGAGAAEDEYFDEDGEERDEMDDFLDDDLGGPPEGRRRRRARSGLPAGTSAAAMRVGSFGGISVLFRGQGASPIGHAGRVLWGDICAIPVRATLAQRRCS